MPQFDSYNDITEPAAGDTLVVLDRSVADEGDPNQSSMRQMAVGNLLAGLDYQSNMVKNYPSLEKADGTAPLWYSTYNATLTEEDATGEAISNAPNERLLKLVGSGVSPQFWQTYTTGVENNISPDGGIISMSCWVYSASTTETLSAALAQNTAAGQAHIASQAVSYVTASGWQRITLHAEYAADTSYLYIVFWSSDSATTFYVANIQVNPGPVAFPWRERGLTYRWSPTVVYNADPGGSAQSLVLTSYCNVNAALVQLMMKYTNSTTQGRTVFFRPPHQSSSVSPCYVACENINTTSSVATSGIVLSCGPSQTINMYSNAPVGETETVVVTLQGWWEWE